MISQKEKDRNNPYSLEPQLLSLTYVGKSEVVNEEGYLSLPISGDCRNIYVRKGRKVFSIDVETKHINWEKKADDNIEDFYYIGSDVNNALFVYDDNILSLDLETHNIKIRNLSGQYLHRIMEEYYVAGTCENFEYTFLNKKDLSISYTVDLIGLSTGLAIDNNFLFMKDEIGIYCFDSKNGNKLWSQDKLAWLEIYCPEKMKERESEIRKQHGSKVWEQQKMPHEKMGPMVENKLFMSWSIGVVAAIDINTGEMLWSWEFPDVDQYKIVDTIIFRNNKLYFTSEYSSREPCILYCIHAETGKLIYQSNQQQASEGIKAPVMIDKYFVGGNGKSIIAIDVESQKVAWQYEHAENIFGSQLFMTPYGFAVANMLSSSIYWFDDVSRINHIQTHFL